MTDIPPTIAGLPGPLYWDIAPRAWSQNNGTLTISAGPKTDLFIDPDGTACVLNAPRLLFETVGNWRMMARVRVDFGTAFDAGVLLLWGGERTWAKLCFEYSPQREPMVVSVVTNGLSDDSNAFVVSGDTIVLQIARFGQAFAFHAALVGEPWQLIRYFALPGAETIAAGFVAQSPLGLGCTASFSEISLAPERRKALRRTFTL